MAAEPKFHPVFIGSDLGIYSLARCFYEYTGERASVLARIVSPQIRNSKILDVYMLRNFDASDHQFTATADKLMEIAPQIKAKYPGRKLLLLTNGDSYISAIARNRERLEKEYVIATASEELMAKTSNKARFAQLCDEFGMSTPPTTIVDFDDSKQIEQLKKASPYEFPVVLKPSVSEGYELLRWEGKAKVYFLDNQEELADLLTNLDRETAKHQVTREFVLQPRIAGNDTYSLSLTAYVDTHGEVTMLSSAHVLLEEHQPSFIGNPAAMIVENYPGLYEQARRFLKRVGWFGFGNFDIKVDPKTNTPYFFEINPRIGRNCYYNTIAGINPAEFVVRDRILGEHVKPREVKDNGFYYVIPLSIVKHYMDDELWGQVKYLRKVGKAANPQLPPYERSFSIGYLKRWWGLQRYIQRHRKHYPHYYPKEQFLEQSPRCFHTDELRKPAKRKD